MVKSISGAGAPQSPVQPVKQLVQQLATGLVAPEAKAVATVSSSALADMARPSAAVAVLPASVAAAAPSAAFIAHGSEGDIGMHPASASKPLPTLPKEIWGEVAKALPRSALLNLRSTSKSMAMWVDRSIDHLNVSGKDAQAMLKIISKASNLKHIKELSIRDCSLGHFSKVLTALAPMSLGNVNLRVKLTEGGVFDTPSLLKTIAPASLLLQLETNMTNAEMEVLRELAYPIGLSFGSEAEVTESDLLNLASVPKLASLEVSTNAFTDSVARAFVEHASLSELSIFTLDDQSLSDSAIALLAGNARLHELRIGDINHVYGENALSALAANRTLERLDLCDFYDESSPGIDAAGTKILSQNTTLKSLQLSVADGVRHLAQMPSLANLTLTEGGGNRISVADADAFAQHCTLESLTLVGSSSYVRANGGYETGALATILSSGVESIALCSVYLGPRDVSALLSNAQVREIHHEYAEKVYGDEAAKHVRFSANDFAYTFALALHPTLDSLKLCYDEDMRKDPTSSVTQEQRDTLRAAWASRQRPASRLVIDV